MTADTKKLRRGLDSLPQEVWDKIYNLVFTATPGYSRIISKYDSKSPATARPLKRGHNHFAAPDSKSLLQVDRSSRRKFAASYYRTDFCFVSEVTLVFWLRSVAPKHRRLITGLHVWFTRAELLKIGQRHAPSIFHITPNTKLYVDWAQLYTGDRLRKYVGYHFEPEVSGKVVVELG